MWPVVVKYSKILWVLAKASLMTQLSYRLSFFTAVLGKIIRQGIIILFFYIFYYRLPGIGNWRFSEILLLIAIYLSVEDLVIMTYHRNLCYYLPEDLRKGTFDFKLTKPVNTLFLKAFNVIDWFDLSAAIPVLGLWIYLIWWSDLALSFTQGILIGYFIVQAYVFIFALLVFIASSSFWTINGTGLGRFMENLLRVSRYPTEIYPKWLQIIFSYVLPLSLVAAFPAAYILHPDNYVYLVYSSVFTAAAFSGALKFWRLALRHYNSASS